MKKIGLFVSGLLVGVMLFGGGVAYASGILAELSSSRVFVDGEEVQLEAYEINGSNYVKLRDLGQAVGFNVYYDGDVQVQTGVPYTGEAPVKEVVDYSAAVNPEVFTGIYTREAYNAVYETLLGVQLKDDNRKGIVHYDNSMDSQKLRTTIGYLSNGTCLNLHWTGQHGEYEVYPAFADREISDRAIEGLIQETLAMATDAEKVQCLNEWLCDHMEYTYSVESTVNEVCTGTSPTKGNCSTYARTMSYLCGKAGIPCTRVYSENHCWNLIYADGAWGHTDVCLNDKVSGRNALLLSPTARKEDLDAPGTRFLQELLVPGSTN